MIRPREGVSSYDFPLFFIRRIAFAKLRSFAHHANILVDLGPPKPGI